MTDVNTSKRAQRRSMSPSDRRQQIVWAAADVFERTGFANTTMDSVAAEIGIAKPTLYHYFRSKDEILHAIHEEFIELLLSQHQQRATMGLGAAQLLLEAMADILELMETHRGHVRVFFEHHRDLPAESREKIRTRRDAYEQIMYSLFEQGVEEGVFRPADMRMATMAALGMCNWAYQWYRPSSDHRPREVAYMFWNFLVYGLGTDDTRHSLTPPAAPGGDAA